MTRAEEGESPDPERILGGWTVNELFLFPKMANGRVWPVGGCWSARELGNYHGIDGFKTFSHARAVYKQSGMDIASLSGFKPPYGKATHATLARELKK